MNDAQFRIIVKCFMLLYAAIIKVDTAGLLESIKNDLGENSFEDYTPGFDKLPVDHLIKEKQDN